MHKYFLAILLTFCIECAAVPAQILILRHAENSIDGKEFTLRGEERAAALAPYLSKAPNIISHGKIAAIYATKGENDSSLTQETMAPLSKVLGVEINKNYQNNEYLLAAQEILSKQEYNDKLVLIAWDQQFIPKLVHALEVKENIPVWRDNIYDQIWKIEFTKDMIPKLIIQQQMLLYGDRPGR